MKKRFIQEYRLDKKKVTPYDGRYRNLVSRYKHQDKKNPEVVEIIGSLHKAHKDLDYQCCDCMKQVLKGQYYIQKNANIFADCFRTHLDCQYGHHIDDEKDDRTACVVISIKINGYYKIHKLIVFSKENIQRFLGKIQITVNTGSDSK